MLDISNGKVRVYNYDLSPVGFPSQHSQQGVFLRGRDENEEFVVERVFFDDIEAENSKSDLFKVGRIRFHSDEEDEIYQKLGIDDLENIMTDKELINFLSVDDIETVKRIINIKSVTLITRMKSMLFSMERTNKTPPHRINAAVMERENELLSGGKRNENSEINKILNADKRASEDSKLQDTLDELIKKIQILETEKDEQSIENTKLVSVTEELLKKVDELSKANGWKQINGNETGKPPKK